MGQFFTAYQTRIQATGVVIEADGVHVAPSTAPYRVALVAHLPGNLNSGNHHVYADVIDANGQIVTNPPVKLGWTWNGRRIDEPAPPVALDKTAPMDTASGNIEIHKGQTLSVWLQDDSGKFVSNVVSGLSTAISDADPATGNSLFHNSFYVVFAPQVGTVTEPTPQPEADSILIRLAQLEARLDALEKSFRDLQGD